MIDVDWQQVAQLRSDMGESFDELILVFLQEIDEAAEQLRQAERGPATAEVLHFMKGAALNLGMIRFARACSDGEIAARDGAAVDVPMLLAELDAGRSALMAGLA